VTIEHLILERSRTEPIGAIFMPKGGGKGLRVNEENEILQRLTRVETKLDLMINARDLAQEALQSTKAAHKRLDRIDKIIFWAGTTVIGAVIVGAVALVMKTK
jgi:hypothetical protein